MTLTELESRLRDALNADASRVVGRYPDGPRAIAQIPQPRARLVRRVIPAGIAVACAAALAVLAVALLPGGLGSPRTARAATPAMLRYELAGAPPVQRLLAGLARRTVDLAPITPSRGTYVYFPEQSWYLAVRVARSVSTSVIPTLTRTWTSVDGPQLVVSGRAPALSPRALSSTEQMDARTGIVRGPIVRRRLSPRAVAPFGSMADLSQDPRQLFRELADPGHFGWAHSFSDPAAVGHAMSFLVQYLDYSVPSPAFLRGLYRMLAYVPAVSDAGWVTDRAGRRGLALAVRIGARGAWQSFRLIVDPRNGRLLDVEDIALNSSALRIQPPYVSSYVVYLAPSLVHRLGARPKL